MDEESKAYRQHLVEARWKSIEAYDKALLTLSGGGLAVSLAFIRDIVGAGPAQSSCLLVGAWGCWVGALGTTVASFYVSHIALEKAIVQVDEETKNGEKPVGWWTKATKIMNVMSGAFFLVGLILIVIFASANVR